MSHANPQPPNNLDVDHILKRAKELNLSELRFHLVVYHRVKIVGMTRGEIGAAHLLAHAVQAHPELTDLLELPPGWGHV